MTHAVELRRQLQISGVKCCSKSSITSRVPIGPCRLVPVHPQTRQAMADRNSQRDLTHRIGWGAISPIGYALTTIPVAAKLERLVRELCSYPAFSLYDHFLDQHGEARIGDYRTAL
jgi:hypothetical protein